jgi:hypothetical protein
MTDIATSETRIMFALQESRKARHQRECHCRMFDKQFCTAADALWQRAMNRELEQIHHELTRLTTRKAP